MKPKPQLLLFLYLSVLAAGSLHARSDHRWVDSVFRSLSMEQKIAQLMIIRAYSWKDPVYQDSLSGIVARYNPGGICFFKGSPVRQAILTNQLQEAARTPLLVSIDAEWGLGMRLDSAFAFPRQMSLGAIRDDSLIYRMGQVIAQDCRRTGIHINWAPVADINNNPDNPVIGFRSFGEDPGTVARKSAAYMKGLQDGGVMAVAKHFPGHGDTDTDSHLDLPVIGHTAARLDTVELVPFRELIRQGVDGVMIAHLYIPAFDTVTNTPSTLSRNVVTGLLKEKLGFTGFVVTDALDMQGVTRFFPTGEIETRAILAGNDILLLPQNIEKAIHGILSAIDSGRIDSALINERCMRILELKHQMGLNRKPVTDTRNLIADLNTTGAAVLRQQMVNSSVTVVRNELRLIPLTGLDRRKIALLALGDTTGTSFKETIKKYARPECFALPLDFSPESADSIIRKVYSSDILILSVHGIRSNPADSFGISSSINRLIDTLVKVNRTILILFGTPYALNRIPALNRPEAIVVAYQDNPETGLATAGILFGGLAAKGRLPVSVAGIPLGAGEETEQTRLTYVIPEETGIPSEALRALDSIVNQGIGARAYPGCEVLFAKHGKVFYNKAFGTRRYDDTTRVTPGTIYDIASVTKIAATTLAIMKLYEDGKIMPEDSIARFLPELTRSNKSGLRIRDIMTHQAGLQDWIPFFRATLKPYGPDTAIYRTEPSAAFSIRVAQSLFMRNDYADTVWQRIKDSPLRNERDYRYSDLGFYLLKLVVERVTGLSFAEYLDEQFYKPLGLYHTAFNPRDHFSLSDIAPTEYDTVFRKQLVWGDVHDPGAAMLGGVSGHAGLFSDAPDMAVIMQMLAWDGFYGGKQYFSPNTVREFTRVQFPQLGNRRGLGFDKPPLRYIPDGPVCKSASPLSFGHSGFTGTYVWADPENDLVYIFLSNRVCPDASNQKLSEMNIRTSLHQTVYEILAKYKVK